MTYDDVAKAGFVVLRRCSICDQPIGYRIHNEYAAVVFDSSCACLSGGLRFATHAELAKLKP
jgi:hypothetical protein